MLPSSRVVRTMVGNFSLLAIPLQLSPFKDFVEVISSNDIVEVTHFSGLFLQAPMLLGRAEAWTSWSVRVALQPYHASRFVSASKTPSKLPQLLSHPHQSIILPPAILHEAMLYDAAAKSQSRLSDHEITVQRSSRGAEQLLGRGEFARHVPMQARYQTKRVQKSKSWKEHCRPLHDSRSETEHTSVLINFTPAQTDQTNPPRFMAIHQRTSTNSRVSLWHQNPLLCSHQRH